MSLTKLISSRNIQECAMRFPISPYFPYFYPMSTSICTLCYHLYHLSSRVSVSSVAIKPYPGLRPNVWSKDLETTLLPVSVNGQGLTRGYCPIQVPIRDLWVSSSSTWVRWSSIFCPNNILAEVWCASWESKSCNDLVEIFHSTHRLFYCAFSSSAFFSF